MLREAYSPARRERPRGPGDAHDGPRPAAFRRSVREVRRRAPPRPQPPRARAGSSASTTPLPAPPTTPSRRRDSSSRPPSSSALPARSLASRSSSGGSDRTSTASTPSAPSTTRRSASASARSCGSPLDIRYSFAGNRFVGCSGYPKCRVTYPLPQRGKLEKDQPPCPVCRAPVVTAIEAGPPAVDPVHQSRVPDPAEVGRLSEEKGTRARKARRPQEVEGSGRRVSGGGAPAEGAPAAPARPKRASRARKPAPSSVGPPSPGSDPTPP